MTTLSFVPWESLGEKKEKERDFGKQKRREHVGNRVNSCMKRRRTRYETRGQRKKREKGRRETHQQYMGEGWVSSLSVVEVIFPPGFLLAELALGTPMQKFRNVLSGHGGGGVFFRPCWPAYLG